MRKLRISVAVLVALALLLTLLSGCGGSSKPPAAETPKAPADKPFAGVSLRFVAANHPWTESLRPLIPEFEQKTGIKVNLEAYFEDQLTQKLTVELTSGTSTIDVFMQRPLQEAKQFQKNGWYENLDNFLKDPKKTPADYDPNDFFPSALASERVGTALTGIPIVTEQEILYYRKDLFEKDKIKVPTTWQELEAAAKHFHAPDKGFYGIVSRGQRSPAVTQFSSYLYGFGGDFIKDGKAALDTPEAIAAFKFYGDLLRKYGPPGVLNMSWPQAAAIFAQGKAAMWTDANSLYLNVADPAKSQVADKVGFAMFPAGPAAQKPYSVTSWGISIPSTSKNKDAAWEFVKWATSKEISGKIQAKGVPGARKSVWDSEQGKKGFPAQWVEVAAKSGAIGHPYDRPNVIAVGASRDIVGDVITQAIEGKDVAAAAKKANAQLQELLDKEK